MSVTEALPMVQWKQVKSGENVLALPLCEPLLPAS
jgi:hypothetical protein